MVSTDKSLQACTFYALEPRGFKTLGMLSATESHVWTPVRPQNRGRTEIIPRRGK